MTIKTVVVAFYNIGISRYGVPEKVTSDQGRQFESDMFVSFTNLLGIKHIRTTPYYPQSNGKIERFHRTLKQSIRAHEKTDWVSTLPTVLLGLRYALKGNDSISPAEMVYGQALRLPGEFFVSDDAVTLSTNTFSTQLKEKIKLITPLITTHNSEKKPFVLSDLRTASELMYSSDMTLSRNRYKHHTMDHSEY